MNSSSYIRDMSELLHLLALEDDPEVFVRTLVHQWPQVQALIYKASEVKIPLDIEEEIVEGVSATVAVEGRSVTIYPDDIAVSETYLSTFGTAEVESAVLLLMKFCRDKGVWPAFTEMEFKSWLTGQEVTPILRGAPLSYLVGNWASDFELLSGRTPSKKRVHVVLCSDGLYRVSKQCVFKCWEYTQKNLQKLNR